MSKTITDLETEIENLKQRLTVLEEYKARQEQTSLKRKIRKEMKTILTNELNQNEGSVPEDEDIPKILREIIMDGYEQEMKDREPLLKDTITSMVQDAIQDNLNDSGTKPADEVSRKGKGVTWNFPATSSSTPLLGRGLGASGIATTSRIPLGGLEPTGRSEGILGTFTPPVRPPGRRGKKESIFTTSDYFKDDDEDPLRPTTLFGGQGETHESRSQILEEILLKLVGRKSSSNTNKLKVSDLPKYKGPNKEDVDVYLQRLDAILDSVPGGRKQILHLIPLLLEEIGRAHV